MLLFSDICFVYIRFNNSKGFFWYRILLWKECFMCMLVIIYNSSIIIILDLYVLKVVGVFEFMNV